MTIHIRTHVIVFLAQRVHPVPACGDRVILTCAVVVGVKAVHAVQLLAVVLVRLHVGIHHGFRVGVRGAEGVVVRHLPHRAAGIHHLAVVAQVVLVVVEELEGVGRGIHGSRLGIAAVEEVAVYQAVLHHEASAEQVLRRAVVHHLPLRQRVRLRAEGHRDVGRGDIVFHKEFLACGTVCIPRLAAVGEVYPPRVVVVVVGDVRDAPALVGD